MTALVELAMTLGVSAVIYVRGRSISPWILNYSHPTRWRFEEHHGFEVFCVLGCCCGLCWSSGSGWGEGWVRVLVHTRAGLGFGVLL